MTTHELRMRWRAHEQQVEEFLHSFMRVASHPDATEEQVMTAAAALRNVRRAHEDAVAKFRERGVFTVGVFTFQPKEFF